MYHCDLCGRDDIDQLDASLVLKQRPIGIRYDLCLEDAEKVRAFIKGNAKTDLVRADAEEWEGIARTGPRSRANPEGV